MIYMTQSTNIVWFGEAVPALEEAIAITSQADIVLIIGTSQQVYPAASLFAYAPPEAKIFYIDPKPAQNHEALTRRHFETIAKTASVGVPELVKRLVALNA